MVGVVVSRGLSARMSIILLRLIGVRLFQFSAEELLGRCKLQAVMKMFVVQSPRDTVWAANNEQTRERETKRISREGRDWMRVVHEGSGEHCERGESEW